MPDAWSWQPCPGTGRVGYFEGGHRRQWWWRCTVCRRVGWTTRTRHPALVIPPHLHVVPNPDLFIVFERDP